MFKSWGGFFRTFAGPIAFVAFILLLISLCVPDHGTSTEFPYNPQPGDSLIAIHFYILVEWEPMIIGFMEWVDPDSINPEFIELIFSPDSIWSADGRHIATMHIVPASVKKKGWIKYYD